MALVRTPKAFKARSIPSFESRSLLAVMLTIAFAISAVIGLISDDQGDKLI